MNKKVSRPRAYVHDGGDCDCLGRGRHLLMVDERNPRTVVFALFFAPRPGDARLGMTRVGVLRDEYNATIEGHPPRFVMTLFGYEANPAYFEWASRADRWAESCG